MMTDPASPAADAPPTPSGRPETAGPAAGRRRRWASAVLATVVVAGAIGGVAWARQGDDNFRPVRPTTTFGMSLVKASPDFTMGMNYIYRAGKDVKVLEVEALTSPNVEYLGAFTVWPRDFLKNNLSVGPYFPPPEMKRRHSLGELVPAAETAFLPRGSTAPPALAVAAGFRLLSGDMGAVNGIRVLYEVDGKRVREVFDQGLIVCVKGKHRCIAPEGLTTSQWEKQIYSQFGLWPE